ncbi:putative BTB/POZ domain-containing protein-like isoform X2 [Capsicum annuum]|nr:putative BTB/POZ domain-containing protein-like isoform X2 [Capsicum annuum]KAF3644667.1 putative BTB/POZ domain-containing protein-like isoform X2 [Capsicum annuum]
MLSEELRFHRLNLDSFKTPYIQHCILEMPISDVSSDLTIESGSISFSLHKFPLVMRSGRIRKLLLETKDTKVSRINLTGLPDGSDAFEFIAKFCYGVNVEITISNVALLRYAARFMKDISEKNLEIRIELINAITNNACKEQLTSGLSKLEYNFPPKLVQCIDSETPSDWRGNHSRC